MPISKTPGGSAPGGWRASTSPTTRPTTSMASSRRPPARRPERAMRCRRRRRAAARSDVPPTRHVDESQCSSSCSASSSRYGRSETRSPRMTSPPRAAAYLEDSGEPGLSPSDEQDSPESSNATRRPGDRLVIRPVTVRSACGCGPPRAAQRAEPLFISAARRPGLSPHPGELRRLASCRTLDRLRGRDRPLDADPQDSDPVPDAAWSGTRSRRNPARRSPRSCGRRTGPGPRAPDDQLARPP